MSTSLHKNASTSAKKICRQENIAYQMLFSSHLLSVIAVFLPSGTTFTATPVARIVRFQTIHNENAPDEVVLICTSSTRSAPSFFNGTSIICRIFPRVKVFCNIRYSCWLGLPIRPDHNGMKLNKYIPRLVAVIFHKTRFPRLLNCPGYDFSHSRVDVCAQPAPANNINPAKNIFFIIICLFVFSAGVYYCPPAVFSTAASNYCWQCATAHTRPANSAIPYCCRLPIW